MPACSSLTYQPSGSLKIMDTMDHIKKNSILVQTINIFRLVRTLLVHYPFPRLSSVSLWKVYLKLELSKRDKIPPAGFFRSKFFHNKDTVDPHLSGHFGSQSICPDMWSVRIPESLVNKKNNISKIPSWWKFVRILKHPDIWRPDIWRSTVCIKHELWNFYSSDLELPQKNLGSRSWHTLGSWAIFEMRTYQVYP